MTRVACCRPCRACPWRRDARPEDIPNLSVELAEGLDATCQRGSYGPEFNDPMFGCHESTPGNEIACAGWLAVEGSAHPNVRLMIVSGRLDMSALQPRADWPELHANFGEVIAKLREVQK